MKRSILLLLLLASGCRSTAYDAAVRADTPEAYRKFLREHPRDENAEAASSRLAELELAEARRLHTVVAYKRFLDEFPDAPQAATAKALLEGMRFNAAKEKNTALAWRQFLADHPDGKHRAEAERALADAELADAANSSDAAKLKRAIAENPDDPRAAEVRQRLDDRAFEQAKAGGARALFAYLREFPAGRHREAARAELLSIEIDGLLFSGLVDEARERARSPLAKAMPDLVDRLERAERERALLPAKDTLAQSAQASHYLRSLEDLDRSLGAPDPLDRWQAAEELGQHVSVKAIDPLLRAIRDSRQVLVRQKAFDSLANVLLALPPRLTEYEVERRLEELEATAQDAQVHLVMAVLLDLSGRLDEAAVEYQRAFDRDAPDPLVLRRWTHIRRSRNQHYSAAVAARQISLWALQVAQDESLTPATALSAARQLCGALHLSREALDVVVEARRHPTEFPDDLAELEARAREAVALAEAKLKDAELLLQTSEPDVRPCADRRVAERIEAGEKTRAEALRVISKRLPRLAPALIAAARDRDPSPRIRALAAGLAP